MRYIIFASLATACLLLSSCERNKDESNVPGSSTQSEASAEGSGAKTEREIEFDYYLENLVRKPLNEVTEEERTHVRDELAKLDLVAQEAERRGMTDDPKIAARISLDRKSVLAQNLIHQYLAEHPITDEELHDAYAEQVAESPKKEYKARHILLETEDAARQVIKQLNEGGDFAKLAEKNSTGPSASNGGDLDWFTPDRMVKPFADAIVGMEPGTYTKEPIQTQFGWHVILLEDQRDATPPPFEETQEQLRSVVEQKRVEELVEGLRAKT